MDSRQIRVLELAGRPYEMGYEHGARYADAIRLFAEERVRLAGSPDWSGRGASREQVLALAHACLEEHRRYAPELVEELQGMADATGATPAELIVLNGFTDFVDTVYNAGEARRNAGAEPPGSDPAPVGPGAPEAGSASADQDAAGAVVTRRTADACTAFLVPGARAAGGHGFFGQTWDMHDSATEHVIMLRGRPAGAPEFLAFTTVGCVGMIGMNDAGIAVGINNLLGGDGQVGVTWPFVIRRILAQRTLDDALRCVTEARLAGAHNYLLLGPDGRGYNVEAMPTVQHVTELAADPIVHTNHCLAPAARRVERPRKPASRTSSEARLETAERLLGGGEIGLEDLQALTREPEAVCIPPTGRDEIATCGAAIMRPATLDFWAVWGLPSENEYEHFSLAPAGARG